MRNKPFRNTSLPIAKSQKPIAKTYTFSIFLFLISTALTHCGSSKARDAQNPDLQTVADEVLGSQNQIEFNADSTFALCQQRADTDHVRRQYRFIVVRVKDKTIVRNGMFSMGYVKWIDATSIEVYSGSLSSSGGAGMKKIIDVNSPVE
jgi:hypothetical protein